MHPFEERRWEEGDGGANRGEPGSRGMTEEGGMRRSGAVSIQSGNGAGFVCAGTHTGHLGRISYIQRTPYLGKVIQHQDYGTEGKDVIDAFFSFVAPKIMTDIKSFLLLLVLDYIPT